MTPTDKWELLGQLAQLTKSQLQKLVKETGAKKEPDWTKEKKTCPKCGESKVVDPDFGLKSFRGGPKKPQSWCRECRSSTHYKYRDPTYQTKTK